MYRTEGRSFSKLSRISEISTGCARFQKGKLFNISTRYFVVRLEELALILLLFDRSVVVRKRSPSSTGETIRWNFIFVEFHGNGSP